MTMIRTLAAALFAVLLVLCPAQAQNTDTYFYTPNGGGVNGAMGMCLNAQNKAVPCSAANVAPSPVTDVPYQATPSGAMQSQLAVATTGVSTLTVPTGTLAFTVCLRSAAGGAINYSVDGLTTPTTTATGNGRQLGVGQCVAYSGIALANNFKAIGATAATAIDVEYTK